MIHHCSLHAAGPVNKRRRGFFTKPTEKQIKQAQESSQQSADQADRSAATAAKAHPSEAADKGSAGNVFRNVIHELRDRNLPVEMHYAHTEDQYWIPVVRIPAKGTHPTASLISETGCPHCFAPGSKPNFRPHCCLHVQLQCESYCCNMHNNCCLTASTSAILYMEGMSVLSVRRVYTRVFLGRHQLTHLLSCLSTQPQRCAVSRHIRACT